MAWGERGVITHLVHLEGGEYVKVGVAQQDAVRGVVEDATEPLKLREKQ